MFFNLFLYLFTGSAIQTTAKTQNIFILVEIRIWMVISVICTMDFSLTGDTRRENLTNVNLDRPA